MLPTSLKQEYFRLSSDRSPFLQTARDASRYTLQSIVPPDGGLRGRSTRRGYSRYGARCVNSLSAKLLLALLPARQAFFRFDVDDQLLAQMGGGKQRAQIDKALRAREDRIQMEMDSNQIRTPGAEILKHLLIAGNVLVYVLPSGGLKFYPIDRYVVSRDDEGTLLRLVAEDKVSPDNLPASIRDIVKDKLKKDAGSSGTPEKTVCVYTGVFLDGGVYRIWQEVEGIKVPKSQGTYPKDSCPWLALRWYIRPGESWGGSLVDDYLGDLQTLEALTAAVTKATAMGAKVVYLRKPNSQVKPGAFTRAETGDVIDGNPEDITVVETKKQTDLATARQMIADIKQELAYAFALSEAIQRQAERVTAEEIRTMAQDLDSLLGGNYSHLSAEFQRPLLARYVLQMERQGKLPALPKGAVKPVITTGLEALGRGAELENLRAYVKDIVDLGGPDALKTWLNFGDLLTRLATARGIKAEGLINDADTVAQSQQQDQMAALVQQLGPNAITQLGGLAKQGMTQQAPSN
jgi:hypothetical protein